VRTLESFKTALNFEPSAFENAASYPKSETKVQCCDDRPTSWASLVKLRLHTPEKAPSVLPHPLKLHSAVIRFRSNFVQSLDRTPEVL